MIPMFNTTAGPAELLPAAELALALGAAAPELPGKVEGPPAFLLDANRQISGKRFIENGDFDNRWYVFESDFPSESLLASQGVNSRSGRQSQSLDRRRLARRCELRADRQAPAQPRNWSFVFISYSPLQSSSTDLDFLSRREEKSRRILWPAQCRFSWLTV